MGDKELRLIFSIIDLVKDVIDEMRDDDDDEDDGAKLLDTLEDVKFYVNKKGGKDDR